MCCEKGTNPKIKPKNKIPPTKKYHPNCLVRESSPWIMSIRVWVCVHCWFPPWMLVLGFSFYTHTQAHKYILSNIFRFFLIRSCSSERRAVLTHTHICIYVYSRTSHTYTESKRSHSRYLFLSCIYVHVVNGRGCQTKTTLVAAPCKKIDFAG